MPISMVNNQVIVKALWIALNRMCLVKQSILRMGMTKKMAWFQGMAV